MGLSYTILGRDLPELSRSSSLFSDDSHAGVNKAPALYAGEFTELSEIGRGAFGRVVKVRKRTDAMVYAVKISWTAIKGERDQEARAREIHALARCDHPHILRYFFSWFEDGLMYLQTEYCPGGSISKRPVSHWTQPNVVQLLLQISSALKYLHAHKMAHMDIKGENIYLSVHNTFKLGDFGLVAFLEEVRSLDFGACRSRSQLLSQDSCASQEEGDKKYLALELLNDKSNLPAADVFALGISVYELCSGRALPGCGEAWQALRRGQLGSLPQLSEPLYALIRRMMAPDPLARPTAAEVEDQCRLLVPA